MNISIRRSATRGLRSAPARQLSVRRQLRCVCVAMMVVFVVTTSVPAEASQDATRIAGVEIEGNTTIPKQAILQHIRTQAGREVNAQQIREDKRKLWNTRWFSGVEHEVRQTPEGAVLVFQVQERPIVRRVTYKGNRKIKRKLLDTWTGLQVGSPMDPSANREAARQIERRYKDQGFRHARVKLERGGEPNDREVVFVIQEGPKVRVYKRVIRGSEFVSPGRVKTKLQTKAAFLGLPIGGLFNPETIPNDIEALKQYYHGLGFFDVEVAAKPVFSQDKAWVTVYYTIKEKTRYKVRNIETDGNAAIPTTTLAKGWSLREGDYFNARFMNKDVSDMLNQYDERGRYFAQVQPVPRFLESPGQVDLVYEIDEDRVRYLRFMNVQFLNERSNTKETVVLDRSPISPGDAVTRRKLRQLQGRLASSGIFEQGGIRVQVKPVDDTGSFASGRPGQQDVLRGQSPDLPGFGHSVGYGADPRPLFTPPPTQNTPADSTHFSRPADPETVFRGQSPAPVFRGQNFDPANPLYDVSPQGDPFGRPLTTPPPGYVDVNVLANEGRTGRLMFGAGVNSDAGLVGSFVYDEANFDLFRPPGSWVDILDGRAWRGGGQRLRIEAVPGDVVSRYSVSLTDPYFLYSDYSLSVSGFYFNRFYPDWDERRGGGRIAIGKQITPELSILGAIRLEEIKVSGIRGTPMPPPQLQSVAGSSFLSTFRASITHDTRDTSILPTEGHYAQASYEQAFGDFNYPRFEGEFRRYFAVPGLLRPDGSGQHVVTLGGNIGWSGDDTPIFESFYAGGFQSFRGFAFRGVSPVQNAVSVGGNWMLLGTAEYRFPITAADSIHGVVFTDFGTVEQDVSLDSFRLTVGAGLRVTIPQMGSVPLAFDFGFPIMKEAFDDERIFSFYVSVNR